MDQQPLGVTPPTAPVSFFCPGHVGTKGSAKGFVVKSKATGKFRAVVTNDAGPKAKAWAAVVALAAREAMAGRDLFTGPVAVEITFFLPRPKGHLNSKGRVKPAAPRVPITKPDGDKVQRATWDALSGVCFADDAQIVDGVVRKRYATVCPSEQDMPMGAIIRVSAWSGHG